MAKKKLKLHIGCGNEYKKGYINIDAYNTSVADLKAYAHELPYKDNSVDQIENYHLLEHLDRGTCDVVLREWFRILKPGGKLIIEVPNLIRNMQIFLKATYDERWNSDHYGFNPARIQTIYGPTEEKGQLHKNGFDKVRLKKILQLCGFADVRVFNKKGTPKKGENIIAFAKKTKSTKDEVVESNLTKAPTYFKKGKDSISFIRKRLRIIKIKLIYVLRYLADFIEETRLF